MTTYIEFMNSLDTTHMLFLIFGLAASGVALGLFAADMYRLALRRRKKR
jgi:hypothetical protein